MKYRLSFSYLFFSLRERDEVVRDTYQDFNSIEEIEVFKVKNPQYYNYTLQIL